MHPDKKLLPVSRRLFLTGVGAASGLCLPPALSILLRSLPGAGLGLRGHLDPSTPAHAQDAGAADFEPDHSAQDVRVRASVTSPEGARALETYAQAVRLMHERPDGDPRSWVAQAAIHDRYCPHGNWYFLPWHRAYLYGLEEIVRNLTGQADFALPYWDWTVDRNVPAAFWGQDNPLDPAMWNDPDPYLGDAPGRFASQTDVMPEDAVGEPVIRRILEETEFEAFASYEASAPRPEAEPFGSQAPFESGPHNIVHGVVNGHMGNFLSPLDPLFFAHHCNVDRIWAEWNARGNANTARTEWHDYRFLANFVNGAGEAIERFPIFNMLDTRTLGYRYDSIEEPADAAAVARRRPTAARQRRVVSRLESARPLSAAINRPGSLTVDLPGEASAALEQSLQESGGDDGLRVFADLSGLQLPENQSSAIVRVFLNCDYLSAATPTNDPHFVANVGFFGLQHGGHGARHASHAGFTVDLTPTLKRLGTRTGAGSREDTKSRSGSEAGAATGRTDVDMLNDLISGGGGETVTSTPPTRTPPGRGDTGRTPRQLQLQVVPLSLHQAERLRARGGFAANRVTIRVARF